MTRLHTKRRATDSYNAASRIFQMILQEIRFHAFSRRYLTEQDFELLSRYYSSWMRPSNVPFLGYCFARRLQSLVSCIAEQDGTLPTVLDCGCGLGSESMACGLLGCRVVGVDLNPERVSVAVKRLKYYREELGIEPAVDFVLKNILKYTPRQEFDIVYAREFISHIWSLSAFLQFAEETSREKGHLIITDANPLNPLVSVKAYSAHRKNLFTAVRDPESDEKVQYACERLFSAYYLRKSLEKHGFVVKTLSFFGFVPGVPPRLVNVIRTFEKATSSVPLGALYEVVGVKTGRTKKLSSTSNG